MFILDSLIIAGIRWALETTITAAEAEMNDDTALREQLLAAEMSREMGEISDEDFAAIEADLLARIREIKERREGGSAPLAFGGAQPLETSADSRFQVEASVSGDFYDSAAAPHTTVVETTSPTHGNLFQTEGERSIEVLDMDRSSRSSRSMFCRFERGNDRNDRNDPNESNDPKESNDPNDPNETPREVNSTLTYVSCLVQGTRRPALRDVPAGLSESRDLRLLDAGDGVWLVATSVPESKYSEAALERGLQNLEWVGHRAMEHEAVVEHFLAAPAVLPMQLFTLFTSDERAVAHVVGDRKRIARILARVERKVEWGLRLTWDEKAARESVERAHRSPASGTAFLSRKRDLLNVSRAQLTAARAEADRLYRALAREATDARRRTATEQAVPGSRLLLDAAFLVPTSKGRAFRAALRRNTKRSAAPASWSR